MIISPMYLISSWWPRLTRGHLNTRSLSHGHDHLYKGASKPCSGLSFRDRRKNLAGHARQEPPASWPPPTHQTQETRTYVQVSPIQGIPLAIVKKGLVIQCTPELV